MIKKLLLYFIARYRAHGGGKVLLGVECNFEPSCSAYTYEAISSYGLVKGGKMALNRLSRCHSRDCFCKCIEPVPGKRTDAKTV